MKYWVLFVCIFTLTIACKQKKANLSGDIPVKVNDFVAAFPVAALPYTIADTALLQTSDTTHISHKIFNQFIPDSVLQPAIDTDESFEILPVVRVEKPKDKEYYLLANIKQKKKVFLVVLVFSKKNKFLAARILFDNQQNEGYQYSLTVNKEPTFIVSQEKINPETKLLQFTRVGWIYATTTSTFMVVVNDSNEDVAKLSVVLNPIDTLPQKNKLSGDYLEDGKNFISLRDGKDANTYLFFIHFEKKGGTCIGELKGDMKLKDATNAVYSVSGDPCIIDFVFKNNEITLKEQGSCGNRRGIECFFNDTFIKKKIGKTNKQAKQTHL